MVSKIYIDKLLTYVPLNGLVYFRGTFYRKGRTNRVYRETRLFKCDPRSFCATDSFIFVPMCVRVNFFKEDGTK